MGLQPGPGTTSPLRLLLAEDSENAAVDLVSALQAAGYRTVCDRVFSPESMAMALEAHAWDVVICGSTVPRLDVMMVMALAIIRGRGLATPVVVFAQWRDEAQRRAWMRAGVGACVRPGRTAELAEAIAQTQRLARCHAGVPA